MELGALSLWIILKAALAEKMLRNPGVRDSAKNSVFLLLNGSLL